MNQVSHSPNIFKQFKQTIFNRSENVIEKLVKRWVIVLVFLTFQIMSNGMY